MLASGFKVGPGNLVTNLQQTGGGSDDCALVLIWRTLARQAKPDKAHKAHKARQGPAKALA
jgi:hypothetical protein